MKRLILFATGLTMIVLLPIGVGRAVAVAEDKWPPQFPREGAKKLFENDKVIVWDQDFISGKAPFMHKHIYDEFVIALKDGPVKTFTPDGKMEPREHFGDGPFPSFFGYYKAPLGPHGEIAADPARLPRAMFVELKDTLVRGCKDYSTAAACQAGGAVKITAAKTPSPTAAYVFPVDKGKKYPPQFPRDGAIKMFENDKIIVWDTYFPHHEGTTYMHKHVRDIVVFTLSDGARDLMSPDGKVSKSEHFGPGPWPSFLGYYEAGLGPHSEVGAPKNKARSFNIEIKGTEPKGCKEWSTDPMCR